MDRINFDSSSGGDELMPYTRELCENDLVLWCRDALPPPAPDETPPNGAPHSPPDDPVLRLENQTAGGISIVLHLGGAKNPGFSVRAIPEVWNV